MILILGGGLAGLSAAHHLEQASAPWLLLERESDVGGLARSVEKDGFRFDYTGHVLHPKRPDVQALIDRLLGDDQVHLERSAWVQFAGRTIPYPFQAHVRGLPAEVALECVRGFAESLLPEHRLAAGSFGAPNGHAISPSFLDVPEPHGAYAASFADWAMRTFGAGFARHFFLPYNAKCFACDPATLSADWVSWAVPRPSLEEVLRGALDGENAAFGYHPTFRYPKSGGIRRLADALMATLPQDRVRRGARVRSIDPAARTARLYDGTALRFDAVIATNPLPELARQVVGLPADLVTDAAALRATAIASFNFGLDGEFDHRRHWVYFPEPRFRFHRVSFPAHLTQSMAPAGKTSVSAEVAYPTGADGSFAVPPGAEDAVLAELVDAGVIDDPRRVVTRVTLALPCAYALHDEQRRRALRRIFPALIDRRVIPAGRYATWSYLSMEDAIVHGREAAEHVARTA